VVDQISIIKHFKMNPNLHIFKTPEELADEFAGQLMSWIENHSGKAFHLAISGGKTPDLLFSVLAEKYADSKAKMLRKLKRSPIQPKFVKSCQCQMAGQFSI
jgi:hypothetical protein